MSFYYMKILFCLILALANFPNGICGKGKVCGRAIVTAMSDIKYKETSWTSFPMLRLLLDGYGVHESSKVISIEKSKVVVGIVSRRTTMGVQTLVAIFCRLIMGQPVVIWVGREDTRPEIQREIEAGEDDEGPKLTGPPMEAAIDARIKMEREKPLSRIFDGLLDTMEKNGATIHYEVTGQADNNAFFKGLPIAFVYDGYTDDQYDSYSIAIKDRIPMECLRHLKQDKNAILWAVRTMSYFRVYRNPDNADQKRVPLADHITAINYFPTANSEVIKNQHLAIPQIVYDVIENVGEYSPVPHDVFVTSYNGSDDIGDDIVKDFDKLQQLITKSFQVTSPE